MAPVDYVFDGDPNIPAPYRVSLALDVQSGRLHFEKHTQPKVFQEVVPPTGVVSVDGSGKIPAAQIPPSGAVAQSAPSDVIDGSKLAIAKSGVWNHLSVSPQLNSHQGYATDGAYHYTVDTGTIYKRDYSTWAAVVTNSTPFASAVSGPYTHLGAPALYNGKLYVPAARVNANGSHDNEAMLVYNTSDLSLAQEITEPFRTLSVSEGSPGSMDSVAIDAVAGKAYMSSWQHNGDIQIYNFPSFSYDHTVAVTPAITKSQGTAVRNGVVYVASEAGGLYTIDLATGAATLVFQSNLSGFHEGIDFSQPELRWIISPSGNGDGYLHMFTDRAMLFGYNGLFLANGATIPVSGVVSGGTAVSWTPDTVPGSPSAYDDEFSTSPLNAKWTPYTLVGGSPAKATSTDVNVVPSRWRGHFRQANADTQQWLKQSFAPGNADFDVTLKGEGVLISGNMGFYLACMDATEQTGVKSAIEFNSSKSSTINSLNAQVGVCTSGVFNNHVVDVSVYGSSVWYLHLQRVSGTWSIHLSHDGVSWQLIGTTSQAVTVDHLTIGMGVTTGIAVGTDVWMAIDWVRVNWLRL